MMMNPTLWRTSRVLAGETRLGLLRLIVQYPDRTVSNLAERAGISQSRASQELRRLQSRGLVRAVRSGPIVRYRPVTDPQVPSANPLLTALQKAFAREPNADHAEIIRIAKGFSHTRRLAVLRTLCQEPADLRTLIQTTGISRASLQRHVRTLKACGLVARYGRMYRVLPGSHPLLVCLIRLLQPPRRAG
ncbi:MAG: ArsR family transcriptional regulator [Kiritimatiellae bacterium]|nr:ArsR family transcriptional regulator [Kiritimatiellia bacterium]